MTLYDALAAARVYDLAHGLEASTPTSPNHPPFRMALLRRHGDTTRADGSSASNELFTMGGHTGTHIDALCHVSAAGLLHGDVNAAAAMKGGRFSEHGVETVAPFLCRGILLDVPRVLGLETLPPAHPVTGDELGAAAVRAGVEVRVGDTVLVRTGWPVGRFHDSVAMVGHDSGVPGPNESGARWLSERGVRAVGSDTIAFEWLAPGRGHSLLPVHRHLLVEAGIHIIELLQLEDIARDGVAEFLFVAVPLKLIGATGSPLRPLAVVA